MRIKLMNGNRILGLYEVEGSRKIEINLTRVIIWTLLFTNAFFVSYFLVKIL